MRLLRGLLFCELVSADFLMGRGGSDPCVQRPTGSLARLAHPIPFDAFDGSPVDIIVLLLLPTGPQGIQLNALARIARTLRDPARRERLRQAQTRDALYAALASQAA
jgi:PTS system nitrogen regulatory IIA component